MTACKSTMFVWPTDSPLPDALEARLSEAGFIFRTRASMELELGFLATYQAIVNLIERGIEPRCVRAFCNDQVDLIIQALMQQANTQNKTDFVEEPAGPRH